MNPRIQELYDQAFTLGTSGYSNGELDVEKFAELIVKQCLKLAHDEHKMALEFEWDNDDTATSIREAISKHFGVER